MKKLFLICSISYVAIYSAEGPFRYLLNLFGADSMIFARDLLILLPLMLLFVSQSFRGRVHPAYWVFLAVVGVHGSISYLNFHTMLPAVYGAKFLMPLLFGFIAATSLTDMRGRPFAVFCIIWLVTVTALAVDKIDGEHLFPWIGMKATIGDLKVEISQNWDITSGPDRRVAGFTRSSIDAAMLLPMLALTIAPRYRFFVRLFVVTASEWALYLTTQKGAAIAFGVIGFVLCLPRKSWYRCLNGLCLAFAVLAVLLPLLSQGLLVSTEGGTFSLASLGMRVELTWPDAFRWIANNNVFPFGAGLGGIGGAQRQYAADSLNPADNIFVFLYGNFGLLGVFYLIWAACAGLRIPSGLQSRSIVSLCLLAQNIGYGAVLSMMEGQVSMLFTGAAMGSLWLLRHETAATRWSDNFRTGPSRLIPQAPPRVALPGNRTL
ncbi:MAG: hypothetical protein JO227_13575 [Acetobacteraceae bacterium]|nr:hypothetical protein [Acetobacteraceae bacterium]